MVRKALIALALLAPPALAQDSNTNCTTFGNTLNCNTHSNPGFDWGAFNRQQAEQQQQTQQNFQNLAQAIAERRRRKQEAEQQQYEANEAAARESAARSRRQIVLTELKEGNCDSAIKTALDQGDMELALQAKQFCAAQPPAQK